MEKREERLLREILSFYKGQQGELIPILLQVQANFGYLSEKARKLIARFLSITEGQVYSIASFYSQFRLVPLGKKRVTICRGTACHIRGAPRILEATEKVLGLKEGETSSDLEYTLETVACFGCCALAPCIRINKNVHGEMTPEKVKELFPHLK
ncbi:MAG: NADH-quinone oxidoreductase subunit NuoE [Chloroflexi bacterium]|nr:NADH-quinone oxidoreductase subunit NuoE [Chloroflexota bacterium]